jgi:hypothetical protein
VTTSSRDLSDVICAGAALLPRVDYVVWRCRTDADPGGELARACGELVSKYCALRDRLSAMPRSALSSRVEQLLSYQQQIVRQASLLAFRPRDSHWPALATAFGDGAGAPTRELQRLAADLTGDTGRRLLDEAS